MIKAKDNPKGTKASQVAKMLLALVDSEEPIAFDDLCADAGAKYPTDVVAAMHALEMVGAVERYTFNDKGTTKTRTAYKINPKVKVKA